MRSEVKLLCLFLALLCFGCSQTPITPNHIYQVKASQLRVRNSPDTTSLVVGKLSRGSSVTVSTIENGWAAVRMNNATGYVRAEYLKIPDRETFSGRFFLGFKSIFMISFITIGVIHGIRTRIKDSRFKTGYKKQVFGLGDLLIIGFWAALVSSIAGLLSGIAGFFH